MISYLLIILLVIIILSETYALRVMYKKNSKLEEMANDDLTILEGIKDFMQAALDRILQLDVNHIFEGDDDVGYFYQALRKEILKLNNNIAGMISEEETNKEQNDKK